MTIVPIIITTSSGPPTSHSRSFLDEKSGARIDVTVRTSDPVVALERFQEIEEQLSWIEDEEESTGRMPWIAIPFVAALCATLIFILIGFVSIVLDAADLIELPHDGFRLNLRFSLFLWLVFTVFFVWARSLEPKSTDEDEG